MDPLITAAARALAAGDPVGGPNRVALRRRACARASQHRNGTARRSCSSEGPRAKCGARFRSESGGGPAPLQRHCARFSFHRAVAGAPLRPLRKTLAPSRAKAFATAPPTARWTRCRSPSSWSRTAVSASRHQAGEIQGWVRGREPNIDWVWRWVRQGDPNRRCTVGDEPLTHPAA